MECDYITQLCERTRDRTFFISHKEARERKRLRKGFGKEKLEEGKVLEQK